MNSLAMLAVVGGLIPPAPYDHPFRGHVEVVQKPMAKNVYGFTYGDERGRCVIYVNPKLEGEALAAIVRHETGHCNGWPGHHPR